MNNIKSIFKPLEAISPFVVYSLHSYNSYKIFFGEGRAEFREGWYIPHDLTESILKQSLTMPVLYWEWFGYHEWANIDIFVKEFFDDFQKIKNYLVNDKKKNIKDVNLRTMSNYELCGYILNTVCDSKSYFLGNKHLIMKKGTLKEIAVTIKEILNSYRNKKVVSEKQLPGIADKLTATLVIQKKLTNVKLIGKDGSFRKNKEKSYIKTSSYSKQNSMSPSQSPKQSPSRSLKQSPKRVQKESSKKSILLLLPKEEESENPNLRKRSMKVQCHIDLLENSDMIRDPNSYNHQMYTIDGSNTYNLFYVLNNNPDDIDITNIREHITIGNNEELIKFRKNNNIVIPDNKQFTDIKDFFDYSKIRNFEIFDYNEHTKAIIRIQSGLRGMKCRNKYKTYRYVINKITMLQTSIRGFVTRKKFKRFLYVMHSIVRIQRFYMRRFEKKNEAAVLIQTNWRRIHACIKKEKLQMGDYEYSEQPLQFEREMEISVAESEYEVKHKGLEEEIFGGYTSSRKVNSLVSADLRKNKGSNKNKMGLTYTKKVTMPEHILKVNDPLLTIKQKQRMTLAQLEAETDRKKIIECLLTEQTLIRDKNTLNATMKTSLINMTNLTRFEKNEKGKRVIKP
jgi:hypothetical protein